MPMSGIYSKAKTFFLPSIIGMMPIIAPCQGPATTIAIGYDNGDLGISSAIKIAMEDKIMTEMNKLFNASKSYVNIPCTPSLYNPKKICIEFSERWASKAAAISPDAMGYSVYQPPSLLAGVVKSKVINWVNNNVAAHPEYPAYKFGEAIAVLPIHEVGHACGVAGDYAQTSQTQEYFMALPTSVNYANKWMAGEKTTIVQNCSPTTGTGQNTYARADLGPVIPPTQQSVTFNYIPGPYSVQSLLNNWNFKDANNFSVYQTSSSQGWAPPGYYSTYMKKNTGTYNGWATTPVFTQVDRTQSPFTVRVDAYWDLTYDNPLAINNFLCISLANWNGSYLSYDYNFYYRPKNWMDAYETVDYSIYKDNWGTLLGQAPSHDYSTWNGDWISYKIVVDKVQSAGGTGQIQFFGYNAWSGWVLMKTVVDNQFTSFNTIDLWHSTDPNSETFVRLDNVVVQKGIN